MGSDHLPEEREHTGTSGWNLFNLSAIWSAGNAPVLVDQEGGRVQRLGPPHWPAYPPGARYGELYDREPASGLAAARLAGPSDRRRSQAAWHRRRLPAARRCAGRRRRSGHRRPRLWQRTRQGRGHRRAPSREGLQAGRRTAGAQASARPWPRHRRQPSQAAGGRHRPRHPGSDRFRRLPPAGRPAARHDRTCCV